MISAFPTKCPIFVLSREERERKTNTEKEKDEEVMTWTGRERERNSNYHPYVRRFKTLLTG